MPTITARNPLTAIKNIGNHPARTPAQESRSQVYWGIALALTIVVLLLIAAGLYLFTPGQQRIKANFAEAGLIRVGDGVRVAGIPVGNVKKVALQGDHVAVEMSVDSSVRVGTDSSAEVRLLTIVGGHYIELEPAGKKLLGKAAIPVLQTTLPYTLVDVFQDIQPKVSKINANPLRETLVQLQQGFGNNPGAISSDIKILGGMLTNLNQRQNDFGTLLTLATDYSQQLNTNGDVLTDLARNLSSFLTEYSTFRARFNSAFESLTLIGERARSLSKVYNSDFDPLLRELDDIGRQAGPALAKYEPLIRQGRDVIQRLENMVGPDGSVTLGAGGPLLLSSNMCIPLPGVQC